MAVGGGGGGADDSDSEKSNSGREVRALKEGGTFQAVGPQVRGGGASVVRVGRGVAA